MAAKLKAAGLLLLMFILGTVSGIAWQMQASHKPWHRWGNVEHRMARLKKELHLSTWQEQALREIIEDAHDRAKDLHEAVDLDMAEIHQDSINAIQLLLNPDQQKQFEKIHARHHWKKPRSGIGAPVTAGEETGAG